MVIPVEFSETEHLQAIVRRYVNGEVREDFKDLDDTDGNWEPDVSTTRGAMRWACTHKDNDSLLMTILRLLIYYFIYGKIKSLLPDIFGIPIISFDRVTRKYRPQITLYFSNGVYRRAFSDRYVDGEISFRLMDKTSKTITQADVQRYAAKIKNLFATPKFVWHKGKTLCAYTDWDEGYQLQLLVRDKAEARRIIEQVLDIQGHTPDWSNMTTNDNEEPAEAYPENPGKETILGEQVDEPRRRPREEVAFRYATLAVRSFGRGINLVDTTGSRRNPIERVV